jgi:RecJ-like exonuclease
MEEKREKEFLEHARKTGERILAMKKPLVVHHYDCDGISSGSVVAYALKSQGIPFETFVAKRLDDNTINQIADSGFDEIVFSDIGAGQVQLLNEHLKGKSVVVIDHHSSPEKPAENVWMCNVHDFGFEGGTDASAASAAFFCFRHLELPRVLELGIVGAVGDMQDYAKTGFIELNKLMLEEGVEKNFVFVAKDLRVFGRVSRPLVWFLSYSTEPFLPGLSNNEKACALFLKKLGLPLKKNGAWASYYDLTAAQRKQLITALVEYGREKEISEETLEEFVGDVYLFLKEPEKSELRDALEFSTLLNACGRHDEAKLGVSVCIEEEGALEKAKGVLTEHRKQIREGLYFASKQTMDLGAFYFFDGRGFVADTVIGTVAGSYFNSGALERNKPILAFSFDEEKNTKISGRGSRHLIEQGLDLGEVMRKAGEAAGGLGGGHNIAAGCTISTTREAEDAFLKKAKEVIQVQLQLDPRGEKK